MTMVVRHAVREDADAIADAHVASWRAAYRHIFPASILDDADFDRERRELWRGWTHSPTPDCRLQVIVDDDRVVGFAYTGDSDDEAGVAAKEQGDRFGELFGFYLHPDAWGSGAAQLLMDAALEHLAEIGLHRAVLWTFSDAPQARRFYTKSGWVETGETDIFTRYPDHPVPELQYVHEL